MSQTQPFSDRVFDQLSEAIVAGELLPGAKISEPDLAIRFGVSRAPLREAIRRLEERKLVSRVAHQGARVAVLSAARISEIYMVREALEGVAAREAAHRMGGEDVGQLRALLSSHEQSFGGDGDTYRMGSADEDFHFRIIRASGNATLIALLLGEYYALIRMFRRQHRQVAGRARRALVEHHRITDALADRDAELAEFLMRRHIAAARIGIEQALAAAAPPKKTPIKKTKDEP